MHPRFANLFAHPESHESLAFFGNVEDGRWTNGFLWAHGEHEMYPVIYGIPIFVLPPDQGWPEEALKKLREEKWIERNWKTGDLRVKVESNGLSRRFSPQT